MFSQFNFVYTIYSQETTICYDIERSPVIARKNLKICLTSKRHNIKTKVDRNVDNIVFSGKKQNLGIGW